MRGVLACAVMLFHLGLNTLLARASGGLIHDGVWSLAVDFFFILSGFVLSLSYARRRVGLAAFSRKRLARLAPMFLLTTLVMIPLAADLSLSSVIANLAMMQSIIGLPSINMPSWSVPFEMWLPLAGLIAAPLLNPLRRPRPLFLILALILQASAAHDLSTGVDHQFLRASAGLAAGAFLHGLYRPGSGRIWLSLTLFTAGVCVMALAGIAPWLGALFPLCAAGAIWFGAEAKGLFSTPPMQALGRWSFSIYLLHIPVLVGAEHLFGGVDGSIAIKAGIIVVVLALSAACYRWIESPFMVLGKPRAVAPA